MIQAERPTGAAVVRGRGVRRVSFPMVFRLVCLFRRVLRGYVLLVLLEFCR
jgi:hypothetical protein